MITIAERMRKWIGREVIVEGLVVIPTGENTQNGWPVVVHVPIQGKLVEVYSDGFDLEMAGFNEPRVFNMANVRGVQPMNGIVSAPKPPIPVRPA